MTNSNTYNRLNLIRRFHSIVPARLSFAFICFFCISLSGCLSINITPPKTVQGKQCKFIKHSLSTNQDSWDVTIVEALELNPSDDMLFLSGGSQNGAFGAGFLRGWAKSKNGHLPDFAVVTGVSTGALLSIAAFTDNSAAAIEAYTIENEDEVINKFVHYRNGKMSIMDYVRVLKSGGVADLDPMRIKLREVLLDQYTPHGSGSTETTMIAEIASRANNRKKLFVIVTNADNGDAVAFDMTDMATQIIEASNVETAERLTDCFISALVASSVVPMAARPEFIDNTMYIDGGARFGIMNEMIGAKIPENLVGPLRSVKPRAVYGIINGDQKISATCSICDLDTQTVHKDWNIVDLATRSIGVLTDQVYQFSENKIIVDNTYKRITAEFCLEITNSADQGYQVSEQVLEKCDAFTTLFPGFNQNSPKIFKINDDLAAYEWSDKTCKQWKQYDDDTTHPLQFFPNYMKCMMAYGESRAVDVFANSGNGTVPQTTNGSAMPTQNQTMSVEELIEFLQANK